MSFISKWNKYLLQELEKPNKDSVTRLVVFDFDKTLFRSPEKPKGFKGNWWASKESLAEPNVPEEPDRSYWFNDTITAAEEAYENSKTISVLMTGRMKRNFEDRITQLLNQNGIKFHEIHMNDSGQDTEKFKTEEMKKILKTYPKINVVEIWDDREKHLEYFTKEIESEDVNVKVHKVDSVIDEARKRSMFINEIFMPPEGADISDPKALEKNVSGIKGMKLKGFDIRKGMGRSDVEIKAFENVGLNNMKEEAYEKIISQIDPLKKNTIVRPIVFGTMGEIYKLSNGKILKLFSDMRANDLAWYEKNINKLHSGKGDMNTMRFERWGEVDLKQLKYDGLIERYGPNSLYWVEMDEIMPFTTFLNNTRRDDEKAADDLENIFYSFTYIYLDYKDKHMPDERSLVIKNAMKHLLNSYQGIKARPLKSITKNEANEIMSALYTFYKDGNELGDPLHTGNIGIQLQGKGDRQKPEFIIIDI